MPSSNSPRSPLAPPCAQLTAVQIAALRKLSKGMTLYLLDRQGNAAKAGE